MYAVERPLDSGSAELQFACSLKATSNVDFIQTTDAGHANM